MANTAGAGGGGATTPPGAAPPGGTCCCSCHVSCCCSLRGRGLLLSGDGGDVGLSGRCLCSLDIAHRVGGILDEMLIHSLEEGNISIQTVVLIAVHFGLERCQQLLELCQLGLDFSGSSCHGFNGRLWTFGGRRVTNLVEILEEINSRISNMPAGWLSSRFTKFPEISLIALGNSDEKP